MKDNREQNILDRIRDEKFTDDEIFREVSSGLYSEDQNAVIHVLQNYRPCLLKQLLCFVEE
ncbi:MAG TPA: hypothetical protein P5056_00510 [Candidatus Paceibacterota bacterium]|nr:hypothetical protein [Candidatus Paceibacterota bacterium]